MVVQLIDKMLSFESATISFYNDCKIILILDFMFIEGHNFIRFIITVMCLPSINKGVTLPYLT